MRPADLERLAELLVEAIGEPPVGDDPGCLRWLRLTDAAMALVAAAAGDDPVLLRRTAERLKGGARLLASEAADLIGAGPSLRLVQ